MAVLSVPLIIPTGYSQFSPRKQDDLFFGSIRLVKVESSLFSRTEGHLLEGPIRRFVVSKYDRRGRIVKRTIYAPDGSLSGNERYIYTPGSNLARVVFYDAKGGVILTGFQENKKGKRRRQITLYDIDGSILGRETVIYNKEGRAIEILDGEDLNNPVLKTTYRYNEEEDTTEAVYYNRDGLPFSRKVEIHDGKGNLIQRDYYTLDGELSGSHIFTYEFDEIGNWIKMTQWRKEGEGLEQYPVGITYRSILYYK
jgi:hypothetical protein